MSSRLRNASVGEDQRDACCEHLGEDEHNCGQREGLRMEVLAKHCHCSLVCRCAISQRNQLQSGCALKATVTCLLEQLGYFQVCVCANFVVESRDSNVSTVILWHHVSETFLYGGAFTLRHFSFHGRIFFVMSCEFASRAQYLEKLDARHESRRENIQRLVEVCGRLDAGAEVRGTFGSVMDVLLWEILRWSDSIACVRGGEPVVCTRDGLARGGICSSLTFVVLRYSVGSVRCRWERLLSTRVSRCFD